MARNYTQKKGEGQLAWRSRSPWLARRAPALSAVGRGQHRNLSARRRRRHL